MCPPGPAVAASSLELPDIAVPVAPQRQRAGSSTSSLSKSSPSQPMIVPRNHGKSLSQPINALGITTMAPVHRRADSTGHTRTASASNISGGTPSETSPEIPDLSPHRLSRYSTRFAGDDDSPRPSLDLGRPTPPLQSPSRNSLRHSRTFSNSSSASNIRMLNYGGEPRAHSRQLSSTSLLSTASDAGRPEVRTLQPRQYNFVENGDSPTSASPAVPSVQPDSDKHSDVRKAPPVLRKPPATRPVQPSPGSPRREHQPQMTSVWLDDDAVNVNRSRSVAARPARASAPTHRKHSSVSESSPRTPVAPGSPRRQSRILPSEAATQLAAAASNTASSSHTGSSASSAEATSPRTRTPRSLRKLINSLSPLRFSPRKSESPQPEPQPQKTKRQAPKPPREVTPPVAALRKEQRTPQNLQSAIDFNLQKPASPSQRQRPQSMLVSSPRPERPARPSPKELPDAVDMRRLSTDFNRRSQIFSSPIPQSPGFGQSPSFSQSPVFSGTSSPRLSMIVQDKRCISAVSTLSNESAPSTMAGSRASLVGDSSALNRSPHVPLAAEGQEPRQKLENRNSAMRFPGESWI